MHIYRSLLFVGVGVWFMVACTHTVAAATITPVASTGTTGVHDTITITLELDPQSDTLNAVKGMVEFSPALLTLESVHDAGSIVNLWIERPYLAQGNTVVFSGIMPGGFRGVLSPYYDGARPGTLYTLIFSARAPGTTEIRVRDSSVFLHDGSGTAVSVKDSSASIVITDAEVRPALVPIEDSGPPELFTPVIADDPNIFDGRSFLAFTTRDAGSGIDHYEIQERLANFDIRALVLRPRWRRVTSPAVLSDQYRESMIVVKAVDRAGNERIATLTPLRVTPWYWQLWLWSIVIIMTVIALITARKRNTWRNRN